LGKEAWTLLYFSAHWIYLAGRDECPWYPSMRLFRQKVPGDWPSVIARVADELRHYSRQNAPVRTAEGRNSGQSIWESVKEIG
jgi:hypothetical protein